MFKIFFLFKIKKKKIIIFSLLSRSCDESFIEAIFNGIRWCGGCNTIRHTKRNDSVCSSSYRNGCDVLSSRIGSWTDIYNM